MGNCPKILPRQRGVLHCVSDKRLGSVWSIYKVYAVNSFDGGDITDYGDFSDVKQLNIDGEITQNGEKSASLHPITKRCLSGNAEKYRKSIGNLNPFLPRQKGASAEEIAGKSGRLEKNQVSENERSKTYFYENFALQCSFTLDKKTCKNIAAEGATTADVTNYEMPAAQINGIRMNLGLDVDLDGNLSDFKKNRRLL